MTFVEENYQNEAESGREESDIPRSTSIFQPILVPGKSRVGTHAPQDSFSDRCIRRRVLY